MPVTEKAVLTAELRLDVQEFYARYAECLDGGRLQQWPEFFLDSCTYRVTTRRNLRLARMSIWCRFPPRPPCATGSSRSARSEDYEPHTQRHLISNFRLQAASDEELRCSELRYPCAPSPRRRSDTSSRASTTTASRSPARACISGRSCAFSIRRFRPRR